MINFIRITFIFLFFTCTTPAQTFQETTVPFLDFWFSSSAIGDIDNDGDNDVIISGAVDTTSGGPDTTIAQVYINDGGTFSLSTSFEIEKALHLGDMKLFDVNNNGLLDLVITGLSYDDIVNYKLYTYINTGNSFELQDDAIGKIFGSINYGDFDNNGSLDFITNGTQYIEGTGFVNILDIYKNTAGSFDKSVLLNEGSQNGNVHLVDFNNDNALDFIQIGVDVNYDPLFKIFINNEGQLEETVSVESLGSGNIAIADFNADGFLDIVAQGSDENFDPVLKVFFNQGDFVFNELDLTPEATTNSSGAKTIAIGDLNSDGYNDFITIGEDDDYNGFTKIFIFDPSNETFNVVTDNTGLMHIGGSGYVILEDVDNDTQLDLLVSGFTELAGDYTGVTRLFKNLSTTANVNPEPPTVLNMEVEGEKLLFSWSGASDDKTPVEGLLYELRVGTSEGGSQIAKYVVNTPSWMLQLDEMPETIYWAVRSIDPSKLFSDESEEMVESTLSTSNFEIATISVYPNPAKDYFSVTGINIEEISLIGIDGKLLMTTTNPNYINTDQLEAGVYLVKIKTANSKISKKIVVQ